MKKPEEMDMLERIAYYEKQFDRGRNAVEMLKNALEAYRQATPGIRELESYYESGLWLKDYQADEAGLVPQEVRRGMLSEDGVYDLLIERDALAAQLKN